jgi:hypothetical protein
MIPVRLWHETDFGGAAVKRPLLTQMYGPAVRSKGIFDELMVSGLASMYPAFVWSALSSGPSWVSARMRSH